MSAFETPKKYKIPQRTPEPGPSDAQRQVLSDLTNWGQLTPQRPVAVSTSPQRPIGSAYETPTRVAKAPPAVGSSWRRGEERVPQTAPRPERPRPRAMCRLIPVLQASTPAPQTRTTPTRITVFPASARKSTTTRKARPVKQRIKLTEYDPKGGVLREICQDLFERAYGLHGKPKEDHAILFDYAYSRTHCSVKAFQDLLYGHTYHQECAELRLLVPGYKEKPPPKPDVQKVETQKAQLTPRWKAGCLERQAVELFEKAYGLNGRKPEDYSKILQETVDATGCSQRAFEELVFGHSYSEKLETLRTKVEGYMTKTQWKLFCKDMAKSGRTSVVAHLNTPEGRDFLLRAKNIEDENAALTTPRKGQAGGKKGEVPSSAEAPTEVDSAKESTIEIMGDGSEQKGKKIWKMVAKTTSIFDIGTPDASGHVEVGKPSPSSASKGKNKGKARKSPAKKRNNVAKNLFVA
jgi:hypothetical protein